MRYDGPIYRPPSEADSLLVQATVGCPHNLCTFCMVYKGGIRFRVRPVAEIKADLEEAAGLTAPGCAPCFFRRATPSPCPPRPWRKFAATAYALLPRLERITVYGSSQYIHRKGPDQLKTLAQAGLGRIHVGVESGDDIILTRIKKGATAAGPHRRRGDWPGPRAWKSTPTSCLGIGGQERTEAHARETARVISEMQPDGGAPQDLRPQDQHPPARPRWRPAGLRCSVPTRRSGKPWLSCRSSPSPLQVASDHYTNYLEVAGRLPEDREAMLEGLRRALGRDESSFRPFFVGTQ